MINQDSGQASVWTK